MRLRGAAGGTLRNPPLAPTVPNNDDNHAVRTLRGVAVASLQPLEVQERDMANANARAAQLTGAMIPLYVLIAVLTGAMGAAMDSTAGERERSSLEPLMMNPVSPWALALGKWAAVAALAALIALLTSLSFIPAQLLIRSDALAL